MECLKARLLLQSATPRKNVIGVYYKKLLKRADFKRIEATRCGKKSSTRGSYSRKYGSLFKFNHHTWDYFLKAKAL